MTSKEASREDEFVNVWFGEGGNKHVPPHYHKDFYTQWTDQGMLSPSVNARLLIDKQLTRLIAFAASATYTNATLSGFVPHLMCHLTD